MAAQFGKYQITRKLDAGGMAEVFTGVAEGIEGFTKNVAIKRVLPHLVENTKFIAMFLDEARLSLRMTHANVVQVFDIGEAGGTYFIVMEFVDGTNLKNLIETLKEQNALLPVAQSVYIVMEMCRGLSYAHNLTDANGDNLGIVHRDVSPPNVLLSKEGEVKIVDFGLAKATSQIENTDPGVVKGKFAYLSPEAAHAKPVDLRADVFACGIVLWELLTNKRLFLGKTDVATIHLVRAGDVPAPSQYNPRVKPELERIVRKALAVDPDQRYPTCDALAEDLANYLFSERLKVTSFDLRRTVNAIIKKRQVETPKPSIIDELIQEELGRFSPVKEEKFEHYREVVTTIGPNPLNPFAALDRQRRAQRTESGTWRESGLIGPMGHSNMGAHSSGAGVSLSQMLEGSEMVRVDATLPPGQLNAADIYPQEFYAEDEEDDRQNFILGLLLAFAGAGLIFGLLWLLDVIP
ncbi:MAG: serine/threonine protein kinase [Proteobacteria bacterium]|nr:serine/threonine protein kinase [Pseudomonadota bacterium]